MIFYNECFQNVHRTNSSALSVNSSPTPIPIWLTALLILPVLAGCDISQDHYPTAHPSVTAYTQAEFEHSDSLQPPAVYQQTRHLPDIWSGDNRYDISPSGWYRFAIPKRRSDEPWSLLLAKFTQNVEVYFNDKPIGRTASPGEEPVNFNRPFLFQLPSEYWQESDNVIEVRLTTMKTWGSFSPIGVGPTRYLKRTYEQKYFAQITANQMAALISCFILVASLYFWRLDPSTTTYLWLAVVASCWVIFTMNNFLTSYPLPHDWWRVFRRGSIDLFGYAYVCFVHRFVGIRRPWLERFLAIYVITMAGVYFYFSLILEERLSYAVHILSSIAGLYAAVVTAQSLMKQFDYRNLILFVIVTATMLFTIHDSIYATGYRLPGLIQEFYLGQLGVPLLFSFLLIMVAREFQRASVATQNANTALESRVAEISSALETSYQERREDERRHATLVERDRISRDIHDDLGSKLLSLVYSAESAEHEKIARSALDDMRSIVTAQSSDLDDELQDFGADWRLEAENRSQESGIKLQWNCPSQILLEPKQGQQLTRVLRELITNALKHAKCNNLKVSAQFEQSMFVVSVEDDGIGMGNASAGTGLGSVRQRISDLAGTVHWESVDSANGTRAVIKLPMD